MHQDGLDVRRALADKMGGCNSALADEDRTERMVVPDICIVRAQRVVKGAVDEFILSYISLQMPLVRTKKMVCLRSYGGSGFETPTEWPHS
jgi:hypothetical protein